MLDFKILWKELYRGKEITWLDQRRGKGKSLQDQEYEWSACMEGKKYTTPLETERFIVKKNEI